MTESTLYDSLQIAYEFIEQADRLAGQSEFDTARMALEKAKTYAFNNAALLEDIQQRSDHLNEDHRQYIKQLEAEAADLFNHVHFESQLAREILQTLLNQDSQNKLARSLWEELPAKEAAEREHRLVEACQQELEKIWQRARELEEIGAGTRAVAEYERALTEASKNAGDAPKVIPLQHLKLKAAEKRDLAKDKWVGTPTLILARKGLELVERYELFQQKGELEAEFFDENGEFVGRLPIEECIDRSKKLASRFAEQKAQDYLGQARELLTESPGAAYDKIQDALAIAYPSDFAKSILEKELKENVEPAIQTREKARTQIKAALNNDDPVKAWLALNEAEKLDRFTPELSDAHQQILTVLKQKFDELIKAGQQFEELEDFEPARVRFQNAVDIGQMILAYGDEYQDLHTTAQTRLEQCIQTEKAIEQFDLRLNDIALQSHTEPEAAITELTELLTPDLSRQAVSKIDRLRVQIDFRLGVDKVYSTVEEKILTATETTELIPLEEMVNQAIADYDDEERLPRLRERVIARRLFLEGTQLRERPDQYEEARQRLQQVIEKNGDDAATAQALLDEIQISEQQEADITIALQEAHTALANHDARSALLLLEPYRHTVSRQTPQIHELISKTATTWRKNIDQQLEVLVASGDFSLPKIQALILDLERCLSPRLDEWRAVALAPAYANTAADLQELHRWEQAGELWEAAFKLTPNDPRIVEGRRNAQKHRDLIRAEMIFDPSEKEKLLNDLNRVYGDDTTIKRYLAEFYYSQGRYVEAQMAITQIKFLSEQMTSPITGTDAEALDRLETFIQKAEEIENQKLAIRSQITGKTSISELREARLAYERLLETAPDEADKLQEWWSNLIKETVNQLKIEIVRLAETGGTILSRTELLCKILALQSDDEIREQAERMLRLTYSQLPGDIIAVIENPEGIGYGPASQALNNHVTRAKILHKKLLNLGQVERNAANLGVKLSERTIDLNDTLYKLELMLETLYFAREKQIDIKNQIVVSMMTGKWDAVEDSLQELDLRKMNQHRGLKDLTNEVERAKHKRADLETAVGQINAAMVAEDFKVIKDRLIYLSTQDPADETQLQANMEIFDPYTKLTIRGHRELERIISDKLTVVKTITEWQATIPPPVDWGAVREKMLQWAGNGEFTPAIELGRAVNGENNKYQEIFEGGSWSLGRLLEYLEAPPLSREEINNQRAQESFRKARQKAELLSQQYNECDLLIQELQQKEQEFNQILSTLKPLLTSLNESKDFISTIFTSSSETQDMKIRVAQLIQQGRQICPNYPAFVNFDEKSLLGGS